MAPDDGVGSDFVASDSECSQNNNDNIAKRQDSMVKGKPKLTKSKSSMTLGSPDESTMPPENTRAESAPDIQETLSKSLQKGFSQLTEALSSKLGEMLRQSRSRKRSESSDSDSSDSGQSVASEASATRRATKRARRESTGDLDDKIDGLLDKDNGSQGVTTTDVNEKPADDNLEAAIHDSDILGSVAAEYDLDEQCEEELSPKLADIVNKLLRNRLNENKLKEKLNKSTRPKNCDNITGVKVNAEIWPKLQTSTRSYDIKMQRVQNTLLKATIPIVKVVNQLMTNLNGTDNDKAMVKHLMDSVALLGHTNCELVQRRRDLIRPDLNNKYQQLCSEHIEFTSWLFGDDFPKQVQDISATNRVSQQLSSRQDCRQSPGSSYSRHGNPARGQLFTPKFLPGPKKAETAIQRQKKELAKKLPKGLSEKLPAKTVNCTQNNMVSQTVKNLPTS